MLNENAKPDFNEFKEKLLALPSFDEIVQLVLQYGVEWVSSYCGPLGFVCKLLLQQVIAWLGL